MFKKKILTALIATQTCFASAMMPQQYKTMSVGVGTSLLDREITFDYRLDQKTAISAAITHKILGAATNFAASAAKAELADKTATRNKADMFKLSSGIGGRIGYKRFVTDKFYCEGALHVGKYFNAFSPGFQFMVGWEFRQNKRFGINLAIGPTALLLGWALKSLVSDSLSDLAKLSSKEKLDDYIDEQGSEALKNFTEPSFKSKFLFSSSDTPLLKVGLQVRFN